MAGIIGCGGLGVRGGTDPIIRVTETIEESVDFNQALDIPNSISESVVVNVT